MPRQLPALTVEKKQQNIFSFTSKFLSRNTPTTTNWNVAHSSEEKFPISKLLLKKNNF